VADAPPRSMSRTVRDSVVVQDERREDRLWLRPGVVRLRVIVDDPETRRRPGGVRTRETLGKKNPRVGSVCCVARNTRAPPDLSFLHVSTRMARGNAAHGAWARDAHRMPRRERWKEHHTHHANHAGNPKSTHANHTHHSKTQAARTHSNSRKWRGLRSQWLDAPGRTTLYGGRHVE
jgi:hypothetical protein